MDDQAKQPVIVNAAWRAKQAALQRRYEAQRRRWMALIEKVDELAPPATMPAAPGEPQQPRKKPRAAKRTRVDGRQSSFQFYEE
jgi:hypothetical protein